MAKKINKDSSEKKINLQLNTKLKRNEEDFLITEVDEEMVFMNAENGRYWGLNTSSTDIWNLLDHPKSLEQIVDLLLEIYEVDKATCQKETISVLIGMLNTNIIKLDNFND